MSEYELSLLRQRGIAARDSKARRGELRFALPPGYCWNELGQIEMDPDERVTEAIRVLFRSKFRKLGSARQVLLWVIQSDVKLPVTRARGHPDRMEPACVSHGRPDPGASGLCWGVCVWNCGRRRTGSKD